MSFWQRRKLAHDFLWKKNIDAFFQLAQSNKDEKDESKTV